jgi:hypothetical protein
MPLLDDKTAKRMRATREFEIASALANPKILAALNTLIDEGLEPSIAHGCMTHLRRKIRQSN